MRSVMFLPELLDLLDCDWDELEQLGLREGFPAPYELPGYAEPTIGWYRYEVERWCAERVIEESQRLTPKDVGVGS